MIMEEHQENKVESLLSELGADLTKGKNGNIYTLTIIGQVEGHQVLPENVTSSETSPTQKV